MVRKKREEKREGGRMIDASGPQASLSVGDLLFILPPSFSSFFFLIVPFLTTPSGYATEHDTIGAGWRLGVKKPCVRLCSVACQDSGVDAVNKTIKRDVEIIGEITEQSRARRNRGRCSGAFFRSRPYRRFSSQTRTQNRITCVLSELYN